MASLLQKAARVNLVAMDFVLQVTVVKLVLGALEDGRVLSFELSRGTKKAREEDTGVSRKRYHHDGLQSSGLPPKLVSTKQSEWGQTMQVVLTLFLDKRSGRFQGKEYKLRLVQLGKDEAIITAFELATFPLDASLYAHLGAGPSVEQPVDLYAPTPSETGGFANVHLRVRCCETGGEAALARSASTPNIAGVRRAPPFGTGLPPRGPTSYRRPSLPPLQSGLLLGSSFGFSMSGSETRTSGVSTSSSAFSTPTMPGRGRPWTNEDIDLTGSSMSARRRRGARRLRSKFGSKSFNDLDDSGRASRGMRSGSPISFHTSVGSVASATDNASSQYSPGIAVGRRITSGRDSMASSRSGSLFATPGSVAHERTNTVGYNRLLARFAKGPSPRVGRLRGELDSTSAGVEASAGVEDTEKGDNGIEAGNEELAWTYENAGGGGGGGDGNDAPLNNTSGIALGIVGMRRLSTSSKPAPAAMAPLELPLMGGSVSATATSAATATAEPSAEAPSNKQYLTQGGIGETREQSAEAPSNKQYLTQGGIGETREQSAEAPSNKQYLTQGGIGETREQTAVSLQEQQQQLMRQMEMQQLQVQQQQQQHHKQKEQQAQTQQVEMQQLRMQQLQVQQQQQHQKEMDQQTQTQTQKMQRHRQHGGGRSLSGRTPSLAKTSASGAGRGWAPSRTPGVGPLGGGNEIGGGGGGGGASMSTAAAVAPDATGRYQSERRQSEDSTGGGSAVAAPLSSATAWGEDVGGRGKRTDGEELVEMENRMLHLEAALMRSELDLCRARNELDVVRKEATELRASKNRVDEDPSMGDRPREDQPREVSSSVDTLALYHALEGSVALLQIASEKMLQLEETISKYGSIIPPRVFEELQECVIQDATVMSPMRQVRPREEKMEEQRRREQLRQRVQQESA